MKILLIQGKKPADWVLCTERKPEPQKLSFSLAGKKYVYRPTRRMGKKNQNVRVKKDEKITTFIS